MAKHPLLRDLYDTEKDYFRNHPEVAGMATEDDRVIFNPYSNVHPKYSDNIYKNEASRILMRNSEDRPSYDLTEQQKQAFKDYGSDQDIRETIAARAFSGDSSSGDLTQEQQEYLKKLSNLYFRHYGE